MYMGESCRGKREIMSCPYLHDEAVLLGRELLAGHVREGESEHEGDHGVGGLLLEDGHVLAEGVLVGAGDEAVVPVEDAQGHVVGVAVHQPHQEPVVPEMHDHFEKLYLGLNDTVQGVPSCQIVGWIDLELGVPPAAGLQL